MKSATLPDNEAERLSALHDAEILDTPPEADFDDLARIAAQICGTPVALVSLVDRHRQWFKARIGLDVTETPRELGFCAHAINEFDLLVIPDALADDRFSDNPLVTGAPHVRSYAGAPLRTASGMALGALCVIDHVPRHLHNEQLQALQALGRQVMSQLELRRQASELSRTVVALRRSQKEACTAADENHLYAEVIKNMQIGLYVYHLADPDDDRSLRLIATNPAAEHFTGLKMSNIVGRTLDQVFPNLRAAGVPQHYAQIIRTGQAHEREDVYHDDEGKVCTAFSIKAFPLPQSRIGVTIENITKRKQAEEERRAIERMKNEFVSTVSHELRTPLTAIRGALGLLAGGMAGQLPTEATEIVQIARANADRLIRLINDILDLEKIEAGKLDLKRQELDPGMLVDATLRSLSAMAAESDVTLGSEVGARDLLQGDPDRLIQVLTNLVGNAVKFSPPLGQVRVRVSRLAGRLRFAVSDQGPGIPREQQCKLFGKFQQLDGSDSRQKGGTGLGLAISKAIVQQHGGDIGVVSEPGQGATFWFELPVGSR